MKRLAFGILSLMLLSGCNDMKYQPKYQHPNQESAFFPDGRATRMPVSDTVSQDGLRLDDHLYKGKVIGKDAEALPFPLTPELLNRGQERYTIYCAVCHGATGVGNGMIVQRGFPAPPSYHIDRLRTAPIGHFYDVMTNGWGKMYSFNDRISVKDRWAIAAYIRALQLSQNGRLSDVSEADRNALEKSR
jgi:mono/diheme cytochrome c family protein